MTETIADLQSQIEREQTMLVQYEEMERLEDDPRRRLRLQENVEEIKFKILNLETRIAQIRLEQTPAKPQALKETESTFIANVPYGLESKLFGRDLELALLDDWYHRDHEHPFMAVIGLGGQGKSALTWQWQKQLQTDKLAPPLVVWWSFYEQDGTMRALLAELLTYFGDDPNQFSSLRLAVDRLRHHLQQTPALIVWDGAERLLRAYSSLGAAYQGDAETTDLQAASLERRQLRQCVDPAAGLLLQWLAEPGQTQAQTLMTSRLFPQELEGRSGLGLQGVRRHDLTGLNNEAAYALFTELGIRTTRAQVKAVCEPLGYHPLSLRLLARAVHYSPTAPDDLRAATQFDPSTDLLGKREHVLRRAYENLPQTAQLTLSRLAAFRSSVVWRVLADVFGGGGAVQRDLQMLEERGLLQRTVRQGDDGQRDTSYDLHPIVRHYAYDRLADRGATHTQLVVYFEALPAPQRIQSLEDLATAIELYHHLTRADRYDEAYSLFFNQINRFSYFQFGIYQTDIDLLMALFPDGIDKLPRLNKKKSQAMTINSLGIRYCKIGQPSVALHLLQLGTDLAFKLGEIQNFAIGLANQAYMVQVSVGDLKTATENLILSIKTCREIEDRFNEAVGHQEYGRLLIINGDSEKGFQELDIALNLDLEDADSLGQCVTWMYRSQAALLLGENAVALDAAQKALERAEETARIKHPYERDFVRVYWLLGRTQLVLGDFSSAQQYLDEALHRCHAINLVELEPAILLAQARLAATQKQSQSAHSLASEAQHIALRAGYVLDLADIHNFLAQLALDAGDHEEAQTQAQQARDYAWCDGPPYAYQSALDEADRLLALLAG